MKRLLIISVLFLISMPVFASYDIRDFGARHDGETLCTEAIQAAIDKCAVAGGGVVSISAGRWTTGTVYLRDNVTLQIESGATLLGSRNRDDYARPFKVDPNSKSITSWAMIAGKNLKNVAIRGRGTIDGQGDSFRDKTRARPKCIILEKCSDVLIEGVRLRNAGSWMQHYIDCDRLVIRDIAVFNHVSFNNDGLNIDSCRDVTITGCSVDSDDDGIVLKSVSTKPCENVTIGDCIVSSHCNSIKMGTESGGGFKNITISNCTVCSPRYSKVIYGRQRGLAGLALEIVDGGTMDRIAISNIAIRGVTVPIFIRLGNRARTYEPDQSKPAIGALQNVTLNNIVATDCSSTGCSITGLPDGHAENISLSNIMLSFEGGGQKKQASVSVPEKETSYPESTMFGQLPAWGFYCRHVKGLKLRNITLKTDQPDLRHALVCDDVEDMLIDTLDAVCDENAVSILRFTNVQNAMITTCRPPKQTPTFLNIQGSKTRGISLVGNDFSDVLAAYKAGGDVPQNALTMQGNIARD